MQNRQECVPKRPQATTDKVEHVEQCSEIYQFAEETHPRIIAREGSEDRQLPLTPSADG